MCVKSRAGLIELLTAERLTDFTYACVGMNRLEEDKELIKGRQQGGH